MKKITETQYFYNDCGERERVVVTETMEGCACDECEEGELLTSEVEVTSETDRVLTTALALCAIGACLMALSAAISRN